MTVEADEGQVNADSQSVAAQGPHGTEGHLVGHGEDHARRARLSEEGVHGHLATGSCEVTRDLQAGSSANPADWRTST